MGTSKQNTKNKTKALLCCWSEVNEWLLFELQNLCMDAREGKCCRFYID
jgi:hypothetical protein